MQANLLSVQTLHQCADSAPVCSLCQCFFARSVQSVLGLAAPVCSLFLCFLFKCSLYQCMQAKCCLHQCAICASAFLSCAVCASLVCKCHASQVCSLCVQSLLVLSCGLCKCFLCQCAVGANKCSLHQRAVCARAFLPCGSAFFTSVQSVQVSALCNSA